MEVSFETPCRFQSVCAARLTERGSVLLSFHGTLYDGRKCDVTRTIPLIRINNDGRAMRRHAIAAACGMGGGEVEDVGMAVVQGWSVAAPAPAQDCTT